ncbi:MAG: hypothetical protein EOM40_07600 [Clostridia bacterium]|nr:hypothetical protein [Clostridia bacterium]NCC44983.1 hypothetical protein [Clostridia bacterium]
MDKYVLKQIGTVNWTKKMMILFPICVLINLLGDWTITYMPSFPLWLNNIGTLFGGVFGGPLYGVIVGVVYEIIANCTDFFHASVIIFMICNISVAAIFGFMVRIGFFRTIKGMFTTTLVVAFVDVAVHVPTSLALYGGECPSNQAVTNLYYQLLDRMVNRPLAVLISRGIFEIADDIIMIALIYAVIHVFWGFWDKHFNMSDLIKIKLDIANDGEVVSTERKLEEAQSKIDNMKSEIDRLKNEMEKAERELKTKKQ